jgi:DNA-binding GntR family transcriptional regulator
VPGAAIATQLRERIDRRLRPRLLVVAASLAEDRQLDRGHHRLAAAILAGDALGAGRLARATARREAAPLKAVLG